MALFDKQQRIAALSIAIFSLACMATPAMSAEITLEINDIESTQGDMRVAIYDNEKDFNMRTAYRGLYQPVKEGKVEIVLSDMPMGEYAVMLFQDSNGNEELDSNLLGMPKEPWGASLQGRSITGRPGWDDVKFNLPDAGDRIVIGMQ